jgi:alpha-tubulin suppressor-like RCC1 family protein
MMPTHAAQEDRWRGLTIATGDNHSLAIDENGTLWACAY